MNTAEERERWMHKQVRLEGRSKKGRERVKRDGALGWVVERTADGIGAAPGVPGPWLFIENGNEPAARWVHSTADKDFAVHTL